MSETNSPEADVNDLEWIDLTPVPPALAEEAKRFPSGWVYEVDLRDVHEGQPIRTAAVIGAWETDEAGAITGWFCRNSARPDASFADVLAIGYTAHLYPHSLAPVVFDYVERPPHVSLWKRPFASVHLDPTSTLCWIGLAAIVLFVVIVIGLPGQ